MKKIVILMLIVCLAFVLVSCGQQKSEIEMLGDSISYVEHYVLVATNDAYRMDLVSISGEIAPSLDGKIGKMDDRVELKLIPKNVDSAVSEYKVKVKDKDNCIELSLQKDVLGMSYSAKVEKALIDFTPSEVIILNEKGDISMEFMNVAKDAKVDEKKALELAYDALKEDISSYFDGSKFEGEVVIKLIGNKKSSTMPYYYYVSIVNDKDHCGSVLIDLVSSAIVNKKVK